MNDLLLNPVRKQNWKISAPCWKTPCTNWAKRRLGRLLRFFRTRAQGWGWRGSERERRANAG